MTASVTIIIPAFNAAEFLGTAIESALAQTTRPNVIVVDDASTDSTVAVARAYDDGSGRLQVIQQQANRGPSAARNLALAHVSTPWVALLDADDRMDPQRLERLLSLAGEHCWEMVADDLWKTPFGDAGATPTRHWKDTAFGAIDLNLARFVRENDPKVTGPYRELGFIKPLMSTAFLKDHRLAYREEMRLGEDFDLYARALIAGARFGVVDPCGYHATVRPGSLSNHHSAHDLRMAIEADDALIELASGDRSARRELAAHRMRLKQKWAWARFIELWKARQFAAMPGLWFGEGWPVFAGLVRQTALRAVRGKPTARPLVA